MKLLSAGASPYVSKAAMAAKFAGVDVEIVNVDATNGDPVLNAANPLGKIPCLVLDDGRGLYDSRVITRHLDRIGNGKLFPTNAAALTEAELMEAHCDGICDVTVGYMYEKRFRPEANVHQPWLDRLWGKAESALDATDTMLPPSGEEAHIGSIALAATLGYLDLRFAGQWENGRDKLVTWRDAFDAAHPELLPLKPRA